LLIIIISQGLVKAVQRELNHFFSVLQGGSYDIQEVTKGALTQARAKLKHTAFIEMNQAVLPDFYNAAPYERWRGHRLLAIDGSIINLPDHPSVVSAFGIHDVGCKAAVKRSMATVSICYDVLNLLTLDARLDKFTTSEPALLHEHLDQVDIQSSDILLLDRGYPSVALFYELMHRGVGFCIRVRNNWNVVIDMLAAGQLDKEVSFRLPVACRDLVGQYKGQSDMVTCRLVVVCSDNGEKSVLCTSLLDQEAYPAAVFNELYHYRWGVEEAYKLLKCRIGIEVFSCKTAEAVLQDFHAKIFMMTMMAILSFPITQKLKEEDNNSNNQRKHKRQINRTHALGLLRNGWIALWIKQKIKGLLKNLDHILEKTADIIRPDRHFKRKLRANKPPSFSYKQL